MTAVRGDIIKYSSLVVLVVQNCSLVLFMRYALTGNRPKFLKTVSVFFGEVFKLLASVLLVILQEKSVYKGLYVIYDQFVNHWRDALKVLVPAAVYTVQNFLLYVAVDNLPAATYMVTYQLKILTTAVFTVLVLKRKLSVQQWMSLFVLFAGVVIVQYDQKLSNDREKEAARLAASLSTTTTSSLFEDVDNSTVAALIREVGGKSSHHEQSSLVGFIAVLVACCMSGFAGIYFEKILKDSDVSIWVRNIQLAFPSLFFALLFAFTKDSSPIFDDGINLFVVWGKMLSGFDWAVWVTVGISAFGGLVVAVVIKYADNILKAFATSFAIVLNCIAAYFLFSFRPTMLFVVGASGVIAAVFVYSMYPYRQIRQQLPTSAEEADKAENIQMVENGKKN